MKSQEQFDADVALSSAIEQSIRVYTDGADGYTLSDFVVLTAIQRIDDEGMVVTRYPMYVRDGDIPWYRIHGLIKVHELQIANETIDQNNNG